MLATNPPTSRAKRVLVAVILSVAFFLTWTPAHAAPITYFGEDNTSGSGPHPLSDAAQASFLSQLVGVSTQTFSSFATNTNLPISVTFGSDTANLTGSGTILGSPNAGRYAISPTQYLETRSGFTLTFSTAQAAFGFYGTDIGDFGGQLSIKLDGGAPITVPHSLGSSGSTSGHTLFFGVIDVASPFTTVQFLNTDTSDAFGFDDFTIGRREQVAAVPEPSSLALFGATAALAGYFASRRRKLATI